MVVEIDSSNIIAVIAKQNKNKDRLSLNYGLIRRLAVELEKANSYILTTCDMVSIDAFRCAFKDYVIMDHSELIINEAMYVSNRIQRFLPPVDITNKLEEIYISVYEEDP